MNARTLAAALFATVLFQQAVPAEPPAISEKRVEELKNLRFGMFICWSFSTFSGKEWTPGVTDINLFKPTGCDTDQWARTAKETGMGYILFLTKHHDGFCLWDTKTTGRKVTNTVLHRDVLADLKKSCDKYGIKLAIYFSEGEWAWPNKPDGKRFQANGGYNPEMKKAQLKEILTGYGPVEYIWFDHAVGDGGLSHEDTIAYVKSLQPGCFVGFNNGTQEGADIRLGEEGRPGPLDDQNAAGPHMRQSGSKSYRIAEFTYPILPKNHQGGAMWFYSLPKHDNLCMSAEDIYKDYLGAVKYGNIYSLDAGPDYAGKLREIDVTTLRKVGQYIRGEIKPPISLSLYKTAKASGVWQNSPEYAASAAVDGNHATRWGAPENSRDGWLEVDLGRTATVDHAVVDEGNWNRVRKYAIECRDGDQWKQLAEGTSIGANKAIPFPSVKASVFRLHITEATEVPTICEFELFGAP